MEGKRLKYPIGQQDFAGIIRDGWLYIDKTGLIYRLVNNDKYIFLSRPRRFGKSLLLSTIRYYFEGRKELFEDLQIMELEKHWKKHPVLHLELSGTMPGDPDSLKSVLDFQFREWEKRYDIENISKSLSQRFATIIREACIKTGERVVVLIDEYDNPLINTIHLKETYESNRELLKSVYSNLKSMDEFIRFAMLTGVSRFSNTTVFSGLNNLRDISFDNDYSTICGFTAEEIRRKMWDGVERLAGYEECSPEEAMVLLKDEYDGYHFSEIMADIYNPFSLLNCLASSRIDNYWIQSGVPEFLVRRLKETPISYQKLFSASGTSESLTASDAAFDSPVALFYQTGYLTIKGYDRKTRRFRLGIPNKEVDEGLFNYLLKGYYSYNVLDAEDRLKEMTACLEKGEPESFLERLKETLAGIPYHLHGKMTELDFERTLFVIFHIMGYHIHCELATSAGRIDLTVATGDYLYIIELKLDKSAEEALEQIERKAYALQWKNDGRKIFKIGVNFSSETRNIADWKILEQD